MFQVIGERVTKVLSALAPSTLKIKVVAPQEQNIQCGLVHLVSDCRVFFTRAAQESSLCVACIRTRTLMAVASMTGQTIRLTVYEKPS